MHLNAGIGHPVTMVQQRYSCRFAESSIPKVEAGGEGGAKRRIVHGELNRMRLRPSLTKKPARQGLSP
jgi:hypothetical protein